MMSKTTFVDLMLTFWGGVKLNNIIKKALFLITSLMLQFVNSDLLLFFLRNEEYLTLRYGSRIELFKKMMTKTHVVCAIFTVVTICGGFLGWWLTLSQSVMVNVGELIIYAIKIYFTSLIFAEIQILTLIFFSDVIAFMIVELFALALMALNLFNETFLTPLPARFIGIYNLIHLGFCLSSMITLKSVLFKIIQHKEIINENRN
jgi:hypothetical protein